jgi:four helix bundle protein
VSKGGGMGYDSKYGLDDFELYRFARAFRREVYQVLRQLPVEEKYCLGVQMRRAALSITNNIAEGHGRWYFQENIRYCRTARGSTEEVVDDLNCCLDEQYADAAHVEKLKATAAELIAKINSYIAYLRRSKQGDDPP